MRFLLFEWMVGGGLLESGQKFDFDDPFFKQGSAMFAAMAEDLIATGHEVIAPIDQRITQSRAMSDYKQTKANFEPTFIDSNLQRHLKSLAATADQIILIAPESDEILLKCFRWLQGFENKFFGGPQHWIELASNKNLMQTYLQTHGIDVPSNRIALGDRWVAKPALGAGGEGLIIFSDQTRLHKFKDRPDWRTEIYIPGKSVSVSIIRTDEDTCFLPPTGQIFSDGPAMHYIGTEFPLSDGFIQRARRLAVQAVEVLPTFSGYIGIDMILADQGPDVVIEINPRMTMSYCNLPPEIRRKWLQ